jgi:transcriptional regulator with XRE-family HTH domain
MEAHTPGDRNDRSEARARRAGQFELAGRRRSRVVAVRLGTALREARLAVGLEQSDVGIRSRLSQVHVSRLERGLGSGASLATWSRVAAAVGGQLVGFLEHAPGADRPRDLEHLKRQSALISIAAAGGWQAVPEFAVDPRSPRSRSIDVALVRRATGEAVVAEIWDWFDDVGAGFRGLDIKPAALTLRLAGATHHSGKPWTIRALYVVRNTRRNHGLVAELGPLFGARFRGSSSTWLRALTDAGQRLPSGDGLLWSDRAGTALRGSRLRG